MTTTKKITTTPSFLFRSSDPTWNNTNDKIVVEKKKRIKKRFRLFRRKSSKSDSETVIDEGEENYLNCENTTGAAACFEATTENNKNNIWKRDKTQKVVVYNQFSDDPKAVLEVGADADIPKPADEDDVVVKVQASTVSYNDCALRRGMCLSITNPVCLPATPGMDFVGNIVSVGTKVQQEEKWNKGDRVAVLIRTGGNARYVVVPQSSLVEVPRSLDSAEAACIVSTYMTAYQSIKSYLVDHKTVSLVEKKILIIGATGATGHALIQMARQAGSTEVYATAPNKLHRYVESVLGAKPLPMESWLSSVVGKMDLVLDSVCEDGFDSAQKALSPTGSLICIGMTGLYNNDTMGAFGAPLMAHWNMAKAEYFMSQTKFYDVWTSFNTSPKVFKSDLEYLFSLLRKRDIKPHVAKRVCLSEVSEAHVYLELGEARGAVVCLPWKRSPLVIGGVRAGEYGEDLHKEISGVYCSEKITGIGFCVCL